MSRSDMRIAQIRKEIEYTEKLIEVLDAEKIKEMQIEPFKVRLKSLQDELDREVH